MTSPYPYYSRFHSWFNIKVQLYFFYCFLCRLPSWFIYWFILDPPKCMDTTMSIINSFILLNESYLCTCVAGGFGQCSRLAVWLLPRFVPGLVWKSQKQYHTDQQNFSRDPCKMADRQPRKQNCHHGCEKTFN